MRDLSTGIASELSTEDIEEEEEIIHKDSNAELNQEQFEDTFTKLMEDRHVEDTATIQRAMDSNNNDKPAAAAASTGGSSAAAAAASMSFPRVPQQPIGPPPVEKYQLHSHQLEN
jgi:transposase-like protein